MPDSEPQRHISPLAGAFNFRDLGGLNSSDGRQVRHGRLFRSDTLQALTPEDVTFLVEDIGIEGIVDLRQAREAVEEGRGPLAEIQAIYYVNVPLDMASTENVSPDEVLDALYLSNLESGSALPRAIEEVAALAGRPTVFHCAAGKDRTGLAAAVTLRLLGIDDEVIVADYLASAPNMPRMLQRFATWPRYRDHLAGMPPQVYAVEERPIRRFLAELDARYGSARVWALSHGIDAQALEELERTLLTSP